MQLSELLGGNFVVVWLIARDRSPDGTTAPRAEAGVLEASLNFFAWRYIIRYITAKMIGHSAEMRLRPSLTSL